MEDGWKKYRMMLYAGANMEYTDSEGNIRIIETEPVLLDIYDEVIKPYILGDLSTLGSFQITEGEETSELIQNFNDNMKHNPSHRIMLNGAIIYFIRTNLPILR